MSRQLHLSPRDEIVETMIALARFSKSSRIVLGGSGSTELFLELSRRGYTFGSIASSRPTSAGQFSMGLIFGDRAYDAIETSIDLIEKRLCSAAGIVIAINSDQPSLAGKIRLKLERMGFRIEAGARCHDGFVMAARREERGRRQSAVPMAA